MRSPRSYRPTRRRPLARRAVLAATGVAAGLVLAGCGGATAASGDVKPGPAEGDAIEVVTRDNAFEPNTLEIDAGSEVTIEVTNEGDQPHNFVIDDLEVSTGTLESGDTVTVTFTVPDSEVTFVCSFHPGMDGVLRPVGG